MSRNRPLSPHLQVYRPQITSVLSILHRFTGMALSAAALLFVFWLGSLTCGQEAFDTFNTALNSWPFKIFTLGFLFSTYYHLCNGIRHISWDMGHGFDLQSTIKSGWLVVFASIILSVLTYFIF